MRGVGVAAEITEAIGCVGGVRGEFRRDTANDRFAVFKHLWRFEAKQPGAMRDVELPADPDQRVALLHKEAVAEIRFGRRIGDTWPAVEIADDVVAAAVNTSNSATLLPRAGSFGAST